MRIAQRVLGLLAPLLVPRAGQHGDAAGAELARAFVRFTGATVADLRAAYARYPGDSGIGLSALKPAGSRGAHMSRPGC
jgi:hypothetical protein